MAQQQPELSILEQMNTKLDATRQEQCDQLSQLISDGLQVNTYHEAIPKTHSWAQHNLITSALYNDRQDILNIALPALSDDDMTAIKVGPEAQDHTPLIFCALQIHNADRLRQVIDFLDNANIDWRTTKAKRWCPPKSDNEVGVYSYWDWAGASENKPADFIKSVLLDANCVPSEHDLCQAITLNHTTFLEGALIKYPELLTENINALSRALTVDHNQPFQLLLDCGAQFELLEPDLQHKGYNNLADYAQRHGNEAMQKRIATYEAKKAELAAADQSAPEPNQPQNTLKSWYWDALPLAAKVVLGIVIAITFPISLPIAVLAVRYQRREVLRNELLNRTLPSAQGLNSQSFATLHTEPRQDLMQKTSPQQPILQAEPSKLDSEVEPLIPVGGH